VGWFGHVPDFILTFEAEYAMSCSNAEFCALVEDELYHAAQETDPFGAPKGRPGADEVGTMVSNRSLRLHG